MAGVALLMAGVALAETGKPTLVVMDLEAKGATLLQADAATQGVVRGIRELDVFQVLSALDVRQLLAIERNRALLGSADPNGGGGGAAAVARSIGAEHVVVGAVTRVGSGVQVEMRLLDTAKGVVVAHKSFGPVEKMEQVAVGLPTLAQELVTPLLQAEQGMLQVECQEEGTDISVDNVVIASTPMRVPYKLARGAHRMQLKKDGFIAQARTTRIEPERLTVEPFVLIPSADYADSYRLHHERLRAGAWIATGVAVAALGGAVALDRVSTEPLYEDDFYPRKLSLDGATPTQARRLLRGELAFQNYQECGAETFVCGQRANELSGRLLGQQVASVALGVVGVGASITATYLWLTGKDPGRYSGLVAELRIGPGPGLVVAGSF